MYNTEIERHACICRKSIGTHGYGFWYREYDCVNNSVCYVYLIFVRFNFLDF